jgi:hypothetical protein
MPRPMHEKPVTDCNNVTGCHDVEICAHVRNSGNPVVSCGMELIVLYTGVRTVFNQIMVAFLCILKLYCDNSLGNLA